MDGMVGRVVDVTGHDYPLSTERPELVSTKHGTPLIDINVKNLRAGALDQDPLRISPKTLLLQSRIARDAGRPQLADNLCRAAELAEFSDEEILSFYNAMRPSTASKEQMDRVAKALEDKGARLCAGLVREAAEVYQQRDLFDNDQGRARAASRDPRK